MADFDSLCKGCMAEIGEQQVCPKCGYVQGEKQPKPYLPKGTVLQGRYVIGKKVDQNAEGVGYIAYDKTSEHAIYIREFLPLSICKRDSAGLKVEPFASKNNDYCFYQDNFLKYFRALARLRALSSLVPIYDIFSQNNTSYTVSEWVESISLEQFVARNGGSIDWNIARPLFMPIISHLGNMHASGVRHLGICPENLVITRSGKMKLAGFAIQAIRTANTALPTELYDGCSAVEQYIDGCTMSEATDVYGLAASLFFALTGNYPTDAQKRQENDRLLIPSSLLERIPHHVVSSLANALQVLPERRTASFENFRAELSAVPAIAREEERPKSTPKPEYVTRKKKKGMPNWLLSLISCVVALLVFGVLGALWYWGENANKQPSDAVSSVVSTVEGIASQVQTDDSADALIVPDLKGLTLEEAKNAAEANEYQILVSSEEFNDNAPQGSIISQVPEPGTKIEKGSSVVVTLSKGLKIRTLPDIAGLSLSEASLKVTQAGLRPTQVQAYSNTVAEGLVIGYEGYEPGSTLEYGSSVKVIVSKGKNTGM